MQEKKVQSASEDAQYVESVADEATKLLKNPKEFTRAQVIAACKKVLSGMTEADLIPFVDAQDTLCDRCATCCKVCNPIAMNFQEMRRISKFLGLNVGKFMRKYSVTFSGTTDVYHMKAGPCPFLISPNVCRIYDVRPSACEAFPVRRMLLDMGKKEIPDLPDYCHIVKKLHAMRALGKLLLEKNPALSEALELEKTGKLGSALREINKIQDPQVRQTELYRLTQSLAKDMEK